MRITAVECSAMNETATNPDDATMDIGDHLEDLRRRMIYALSGVVAVCFVTLFFGKQIVAWLCLPLIQAQRSAHVPAQTFTLTPIAGFAAYMKVSLVAALIIASPWVVYQVWRFFESGLYPKERRAVILLAPFSAVMTTAGVMFMYYVMLPVSLWFLISFSASFPLVEPSDSSFMFSVINPPTTMPADPSGTTTAPAPVPIRTTPTVIPLLSENPATPIEGQLWLKMPEQQLQVYLDEQIRTLPLHTATLINPMIEIGQYINFVSVMAVGIVVAFQLPVIMLILGWWSIVDPQLLARYRKYCVLGCFGIGMLLTPSDVLSMMLLAFPLWGLFEFGLALMKIAYRRSGSVQAP